MSLTSALNIGRSGLLSSQTALTVTGNNLANLATPGYHRQRVALDPIQGQTLGGNYVGRGVEISSVSRIVDDALEARLRTALSDQAGSQASGALLAQIESIENELTDIDLSSRLQAFFNTWSQAANNPQDLSLRTLVTQEAAALTRFVTDMRQDMTDLKIQTGASIDNAVDAVNDLLTQIETLNDQIVAAEAASAGGDQELGLRDRRDVLLQDLARYLDVSTVEQANGSMDVFVGSIPIVLNGDSRGVESRSREVNGQTVTEIVVRDDQSLINIAAGQIGAQVGFRNGDLTDAIDTLDTFANQLIYQVNRLHSQGQGQSGFDTLTSTNPVSDPTLALSDPLLDLGFNPTHGSFKVHLTQKSTGQITTRTIGIDLDGIGADTTLNSLIADLDAVGNLSAVVNGDGTVTLSADSADFEMTFSEDSSGVLAALGLNTFFTGTDASNIAVNPLVSAPGALALALDHTPGGNRNALALAALADTPIAELGGRSLTEYWSGHVEDFAIRTAQAQAAGEADTVVAESLQLQQQSLSGVNADEETVDLLAYQRAYQANARFITVVDELMQTLLNLV